MRVYNLTNCNEPLDDWLIRNPDTISNLKQAIRQAFRGLKRVPDHPTVYQRRGEWVNQLRRVLIADNLKCQDEYAREIRNTFANTTYWYDACVPAQSHTMYKVSFVMEQIMEQLNEEWKAESDGLENLERILCCMKLAIADAERANAALHLESVAAINDFNRL